MKKITVLTLVILTLFGCRKDNQPIPRPSISLSENHGFDSAVIIITIYGYQSFKTVDSIYFNGKGAAILGYNDSQMVTRVPTLAGSGDVTFKLRGNTINAGKFKYDTSYRVSTIAANLNDPFYIARDTAGNLFVSCYGENAIRKFDTKGSNTVWKTVPSPSGLTFDAAGNLYFVSNPANPLPSNIGPTIGRISPNGDVQTIGMDSTAVLIGQIALDKNGSIYLPSPFKHWIDKMNPDGKVTRLVNDIFNPTGIHVGADGSIYCTSYSSHAYTDANGVVTKITPSGGSTSTLARFSYNYYADLTSDPKGNLYASSFDQRNSAGKLIRISPNGDTTALSTSSNMFHPRGLTRDEAGNFFVVVGQTSYDNTAGAILKLTMH
ncbi:MAG TPA: hypothetical protein VI233_04275 [Puia sp.]